MTPINLFLRKKILLLILALALLFSFSELIFLLNNRPEILALYFVKRAQSHALRSNIPESLASLIEGAKFNIKRVAKKYNGLVPANYNPEIKFSGNSLDFEKAFSRYIKGLDLKALATSDEISLARVFYTIGVLAYKEGEVELFPSFLQTSVYLEPELSHYHVELANYYLALEKRDKSETALKYCLMFKHPAKHCQEYYHGNFSANYPEEVGFLEKELEKYYSSL